MRTIHHRVAAALRGLRRDPSAIRSNDVDVLARRVEHLEAALEGLQDAVYRQDVHHDRQIADLRKHPPLGSARHPDARP